MSMGLTEFEQKGYDSFMELWVSEECIPNASRCQARYIRDEPARAAFIKGWNRAKREALGEKG